MAKTDIKSIEITWPNDPLTGGDFAILTGYTNGMVMRAIAALMPSATKKELINTIGKALGVDEFNNEDRIIAILTGGRDGKAHGIQDLWTDRPE